MPSTNSKSSTNKVLLLALVFVGVISAVLIIGVNLSAIARKRAQDRLAQQFEAPKDAVKTQVKKAVYKFIDEDGNVRYAEILSSGQVNLYDENYNLLKAGIQGFARINNLLKNLNTNYSDYEGSGDGEYTLTIETNKGTVVINIEEIPEEIIEEIEEIIEETFSPTPTPIPPSPTSIPSGPTSTPTPTIFQPTTAPTITPGGPSPTPTPLPDYMTAPPFTCDDYSGYGRPVTISNVICGAD